MRDIGREIIRVINNQTKPVGGNKVPAIVPDFLSITCFRELPVVTCEDRRRGDAKARSNTHVIIGRQTASSRSRDNSTNPEFTCQKMKLQRGYLHKVNMFLKISLQV
jgi:hypothetical protein